MKILYSGLLVFFVIMLLSCSHQKKSSQVPVQGEKEKTAVGHDALPAPKEGESDHADDALSKAKRMGAISCREDTSENFNLSGIEVMPFIRVAFYDITGDGRNHMIAGNKHGYLNLYKNGGDPQITQWRLMTGYFDGIKVGAFAAPAVGDLDGDGKAEVVVGTGGFSSDSGRLLFFKNGGTKDSPIWAKIDGIKIHVGNDATPVMVDYNFDGKPDLIVGNSEGRVAFFKNTSSNGKIKFEPDKSLLIKGNFGMYAVPGAVQLKDKVVLAIANSMGKLCLFELRKEGKGLAVRELKTVLLAKSFPSPVFVDFIKKGRFDLLLADGDGQITYFENKHNDFSSWEMNGDLFNNRVSIGPACAPTLSSIRDKTFLVAGNIDGTLRLYEHKNSSAGLPWVERKNYFHSIKLLGFSRGLITQWDDKEILIAGQSNGKIRAFVKAGSEAQPIWKEEERFFQGINIKEHSTPAVFDIDGDGQWELVSGAANGRVYAYKIKGLKNGLPVWEEIKGMFDDIRVDGFSTPTIARDKNILYLFVGQQDGRIRTYISDISGCGDHQNGKTFDYAKAIFSETSYLQDVRMNNHSSPFIRVKDDMLEIVSGDYDGNLRHFSCRMSTDVASTAGN